MVQNTTTCTDEKVYTTSKSSGLIFDVDTTIDGKRIELVLMVL